MAFKFFQGDVKLRLGNITITQPRYPRIVTSEIQYPEEYVDRVLRDLFRKGWRACERGREIYSNPFGVASRLIYTQYRAWERGWLECYHNHPSRTNTQIGNV